MPQAIAAPIDPDAGWEESGLVVEAIEHPSKTSKEPTQAQAVEQTDAIADSITSAVKQTKTPLAIIQSSNGVETAEATETQTPPQLPTESSQKHADSSDSLTESGEAQLDNEAGKSTKGKRALTDKIKPSEPIEDKPSPPIENSTKQVIAEANTEVKERVLEPSPSAEANSVAASKEISAETASSSPDKEELSDAALGEQKLAAESKSPVKEKLPKSSKEPAKPAIADSQAVGGEELPSESSPISKDNPEETSDISTELEVSQQVDGEASGPDQDNSEVAEEIDSLAEDASEISAEENARAELLAKIKGELQALGSNALKVGSSTLKVTVDLFKLGFDLLSSWISQLLQDKG